MVRICKVNKICSAWQEGRCLGCDCSCIILGTDEEDMIRELGGFGDERDKRR